MYIQGIVVVNCVGIILAFQVFRSSHLARHLHSKEDNIFSGMLIAVALSCLIEALTFVIDGVPGTLAAVANMGLNTFLYLCNATFSLLWVIYVDLRLYQDEKRLYKVLSPFVAVTGLAWALILGNVFFRYIFTLDEANRYVRLPMSYAFFTLPMVYLLFSVWDVFHYKRKVRGLAFFPMGSFVTPVVLGVIAQTLFYGISVSWCSTSIGLAAVYLSLQNQLIYLDPLTKLYNRFYLNYFLATRPYGKKVGLGGIMIDVDRFKAINDTYGHAMGDKALCEVAVLLQEAAPKNAVVARFAGDEFIILLPTDQVEDLAALEEAIRSSIAKANAKALRPYTLSLSFGHSLLPSGATDQDTFLNDMDQHMYQEKERHHQVMAD